MSQRHLYPESNLTDGIHDPAQSWNSLCVGAFTEKTYIDTAEYPEFWPETIRALIVHSAEWTNAMLSR